MKELEKFYSSEKIDNDFYNKAINNLNFNLLTQKIKTSEYQSIINQIFWLGMTLYRISFLSYFQSLSRINDNILERDNVLVYFPFLSLSSEICRLTNDEYIYSSLLSTIARQMIEQMCVVKEINNENISNELIIKAMIESHNKHVGAMSLNMQELNANNEGVLKVFATGRKFGNLAKKYNYHFLYSLYSGDIHHISTIEKVLPSCTLDSKKYNEIYLKTLLSLIKDSLLFVNEFCKKLTDEDVKIISDFKFINIKD